MNFQQPSIYCNPTINITQTSKPITCAHPSLPSLPSLPFHLHSPSIAFDQRQTKSHVRDLHFQKKMEAIDKKQEGYKRSTNNCHKKYISIFKNLLFIKLNNRQKDQITSSYHQYRNSRVYYFINMCFLKWKLNASDIRWVFQHFCKHLQAKIQQYRLQIRNTTNSNFIHYRKDEIIEMDYSLQSISHFLKGETKQAIRVLYQKNKDIVMKQNQYIRSLKIIADLQQEMGKQFEEDIISKLESIHLQELFQWKKQEEVRRQEESQLDKKRQQDQKQQNQFSVKQEAEEKYPLLAFENSYEAMTSLRFHSWLIQKQKIVELQIRKREDQLKQRKGPASQQFPFRGLPEEG